MSSNCSSREEQIDTLRRLAKAHGKEDWFAGLLAEVARSRPERLQRLLDHYAARPCPEGVPNVSRSCPDLAEYIENEAVDSDMVDTMIPEDKDRALRFS